ncbi:MAG: FliG C-terminal domain-containing protein [Pseudomonadota bacterium]
MSEATGTSTELLPMPDRPDALKLMRKAAEISSRSDMSNSPAAHLTLIQKAAIVLTAIGPELATSCLQDVAEEDMERIVRTLGQLGRIDQQILDAVIVEFLEQLTGGAELTGGAKATRELLAGLVPDAEIDRILGTLPQTKGRGVWERLNAAPVKALAAFLAAEHPQTVAVIVTELRADVAAGVLAELDRNFAQQVVLRLSRIPSTDKSVSRAMQHAIERDFLVTLKSSMTKRRPAELIAGLMNNISSDVRDAFMEFLEGKNEALALDVQRSMFTFEDIATRLNSRDVSSVLREMDEEELLKALKRGLAQESASVEFLLSNLPRRLSERIAEDLDAMQPVPIKEGEAAQIELARIILDLSKRGTIVLLDIEPTPA